MQTRLSVVALASFAPPDGCTHWSTRRLAEKTGIGVTSVHRILSEGRLKPHQTDYWCGRSPDPEFEAKQAAVLGLYLDPPTNASWLNQVEIWFNIFGRDVLKDAVWHSKAELVSHVMEYIRHDSSERAKPFAWTYTGKPLAA